MRFANLFAWAASAAFFVCGAANAQKISAYTELSAAPANNDLLVIVDVSDATMAATGTNKKITTANLMSYLATADAGGDTTTFCMLATAATGTLAPATDAGCSYNATTDALLLTGQHTTRLTDAGTNTVLYPVVIDRQSSDTPAAGIGVGVPFDVETSVGNTERGCTIEAVTTDVTSTSEDFDLVVKCMAAGSTTLVEVARMKSTGALWTVASNGTASDPLLLWGTGTEMGLYRVSNALHLAINNAASLMLLSNGVGSAQISTGQWAWSSTTLSTGTLDTGLARNAAGVIRSTNGSTAITGFMGGGATVASDAAMPVPTGRVFHVSGTTDITSITSTNFASGACVTLIFDGVLNFTDGNNLKLASTMATTADDTISLCYDGTNWYETGRSVN